MKRTGITTDCVCDLTEEYLRTADVDTMHFYITTDSGRFRDGYVVTSGNLLEYLEDGGFMARTTAPEPQEYKEFFERNLCRFDELVHISFSGEIGTSCESALQARELLGEDAGRVTIVDSRTLSTGMGHLVMRAVELRDEGREAEEIARALRELRGRISTTFITENAEYLFRNGRVSQSVDWLSKMFMIHPVLALRDGKLVLKSLRVGSYEGAVMRYVRSELRRGGRIDKKRLFITHAGCTVKTVSAIRSEAQRLCAFDEVIVTTASATVSGNCGPGTVGVIFVNHARKSSES